MKLILACVLAVVSFSIPILGGRRCERGIRTCPVLDGGFIQHVQYDSCLQFCCGGEIIDRDVYLSCCGSESSGMPYNERTQICCVWRGMVGIHDRSNSTGECCGLELFDQSLFPDSTCCNGYIEEPQPFNYLTEMCCNGRIQFAGNTAYTQCCGETAYDRRVASCPCEDNVVFIGIPFDNARCCYNDDRTIRNAYNAITQDCCAGFPYQIATEFCCGGTIGVTANETCCEESVVTPLNPEATGSFVGCCLLNDGSYAAYNTRTQACCGGMVQDLNPLFPEICCGGVLHDSISFGTACCGPEPYFPGQEACCNGVLGDGDSCCNGIPFFSDDTACCNGEVVRGTACCGADGYFVEPGELICCQEDLQNTTDFTLPACCVDQSYDAFIETCCGSNILENPLIFDEEGNLEVSHTTRCCGDFFDPSALLLPYDYFNQACCGNIIVDLDGINPNLAECCGAGIVDTIDELCCNDNVVVNPYGASGSCCGDIIINTDTTICCGSEARNNTDFICCDDVPTPLQGIAVTDAVCCGGSAIDTNSEICCDGFPRGSFDPDFSPVFTRCCGDSTFDVRTELCCEGVPQPRDDTVNAMCCGTSIFSPLTEKCCDGVPRSLNGIPPESAICCGDRCIDGDTYWCCKGQQYSRGSSTGEDIESISCQDAFLE